MSEQNSSSHRVGESVLDMLRLALVYKSSFKMNPAAFWAKQRRKTFQLCSKAPYPLLSAHAGAELLSPACWEHSQLAQIWKAWLVLTRARVCILCEAAQIKVCLSQHMHALFLLPPLQRTTCEQRLVIRADSQRSAEDILQDEFSAFSLLTSAPYCTN